ncbi:MAG: HNH endonuclease [Phycisphaerales bacterium]|nr:HNH endonuclease [Phycisphaerales bacterium]
MDHVRNKASGGTDDPANLRGICDACHAAKTAAEGRAGMARKRKQRP